jgi:hypothetical protein
MGYLGALGFGCTTTTRRDRLPHQVPSKYWHKERTYVSTRSKSARYIHPVVAVKLVPYDPVTGSLAYERVHTSFQSTSLCNISTVNALNDGTLSVRTKFRGKASKRQTWAIKMNEASQQYLGIYFRIDKIDHLIKNCNMIYRSWKYWHCLTNDSWTCQVCSCGI